MKYVGIVLYEKFNFNPHVQHVADRCTKLINDLYKSAKIDWGLNHAALRTIYTGAILPLISYATPVWIEALNKKYNRLKLVRVQRLINLKIVKASEPHPLKHFAH